MKPGWLPPAFPEAGARVGARGFGDAIASGCVAPQLCVCPHLIALPALPQLAGVAEGEAEGEAEVDHQLVFSDASPPGRAGAPASGPGSCKSSIGERLTGRAVQCGVAVAVMRGCSGPWSSPEDFLSQCCLLCFSRGCKCRT